MIAAGTGLLQLYLKSFRIPLPEVRVERDFALVHLHDLGGDAETEAAAARCGADGVLPGKGFKDAPGKCGINRPAVIGDCDSIVF